MTEQHAETGRDPAPAPRAVLPDPGPLLPPGTPHPRLGAHRCPMNPFAATLRWTEWGPADGDPVVCVHGLTRTGRDFDVLAAALAARGRRVLCPDVFGRGQSDWLAEGALYAVPTYVAAMLPWLDALGRPYDWVGTSMGGLIGMSLAAVPGVGLRRVVINDVGAFLPAAALARIGDYVGEHRDFADLAAVEGYLRAVHAPFGPLSDAQWRHLAETSARVTPEGRVVLHYDPAIAEPFRLAPAADADLWALWALLDQPTLLIRGERSDLLPAAVAARMAERPGVRLETIPGCGHAPALMDPAQVALVLEFLGAG